MPLRQTSYARTASRGGGVLGGLGLDGNFGLATGTAYFGYFGFFLPQAVINYVRVALEVNGAGTQAGEVGLFSTTTAPNGSGLSLTKLTATSSLDSLTSGSPSRKGNSSSLAYTTSVGTHVWGGIRVSMGTTQPKTLSHFGDRGTGTLQIVTSASAFTNAGPWAGTVPALSNWLNSGAQAPALFWSLD